MYRRQLLGVLAGGVTGLAGCSSPLSGPDEDAGAPSGTGSEDRPDTVKLEPIVDGLEAPLDVVFPPGDPGRYIAEQRGLVHVHDATLGPEPLLDLRDQIVRGYEQGLLGLALHPNFETNRRLFVRYSSPGRPGTPEEYSHTFVLSEFEVSADGRAVAMETERTILEIPQPQANHNAGSICFGPEGYLYVSVGDGGGAGDRGRGHVSDWYDPVGGGNGQDVSENLLGSILRIDVDEQEPGQPYTIPPENPLVGDAGLDEHYAWGFRNPWRLSVDRDQLYAGDVGQDRFEEVDRVVKGGNYGWNVREGGHCFTADSCPDRTPTDVRGGERLREPVVEYPHEGQPVSGISVIIGNVYRGSAVPGLDGAFVFGDFVANGTLFMAEPTGDRWTPRVLSVAGASADRLGRLLSLARGPDGELYAVATGDAGGGLYRLTAA